MATPAAVLSILVKADTKAAQASLVKANRSLKATAGRMDDTDKAAKRAQKGYARITTAAYAAGGGLVVAGLAAKKAFREFEEAEKATQQTRAVLKSTGDAAKVTAREVENLAQKLSLKSGIDDEAIQSGENLLLTFTKIRNETGKGNQIFTRATSTIVDMSVALGQDLKSSAIQVGKALQDPEKGITALRRVGVAFTSQQEDRIQKWVEEGQILRAQRRILKELTVEFGGSAAAQATGAEKLRVAFDNLFEAFGKAFGPTLEKGFERLAGGLQKVGDIISNPRLTNAEKFGRVMDMIVRQIEKALPKVADAGVKVAGALATGVLKAWTGMNPLAKLFTTAVLIRLIGGRGALLAVGTTIGRLLGGGIAGGVASGMAGGATGGAAGGAAAGGLAGGFAGLLAKGKAIAGRVGWAALGVVVAERITSAIAQGIKDKGPQTIKDAMEQVRKQAGGGSEFGSVVESIFGKSDQSKRATDLAKALERVQKAQSGIGHQKAEQLRAELAKLGGVSDTAKNKLNSLINKQEDLGDKTKWLEGRFKNMREGASRSMGELQNRVQFNMKLIRQTMDTNTDRGRAAVVENFRSAARNIRLSMNAGTISVKEGTAQIRSYLIKAWTTMGFSKADAVALMGRVKGSAQTPMGGELRPNQRGSYISGGKPVGDSVPSVLERGEYVLNRNAVKRVGRQNLDQLNFQGAPRFQKGGIVELLHPGNDPEGHGDHLHVAMETSAQIVALGRKLQRLGWIVGEHPAFGPVGGHVSGSYHYSGQAIDVNWPDAGQEAAKIAALLPMLGGKLPVGAGPGMKKPTIPAVEVSGPDGLVKGVAQGALNLTRKVAQAGVNKLFNSIQPLEGGEDLAAGVGSGPNQRMGLQMMLKLWGRDQWPALQELWTRESGWSRDGHEPVERRVRHPAVVAGVEDGPGRARVGSRRREGADRVGAELHQGPLRQPRRGARVPRREQLVPEGRPRRLRRRLARRRDRRPAQGYLRQGP